MVIFVTDTIKDMDQSLLKRITINPNVCHGKPTLRNSRHMVESILEYMAGGDSVDDILQEFPDLERDDVLACIAYATEVLKYKDITYTAA